MLSNGGAECASRLALAYWTGSVLQKCGRSIALTSKFPDFGVTLMAQHNPVSPTHLGMLAPASKSRDHPTHVKCLVEISLQKRFENPCKQQYIYLHQTLSRPVLPSRGQKGVETQKINEPSTRPICEGNVYRCGPQSGLPSIPGSTFIILALLYFTFVTLFSKSQRFVKTQNRNRPPKLRILPWLHHKSQIGTVVDLVT
ncbi:hypothetical protein J1614_001517 [Plenodomus biglobosus]|nr:hypothetical protein J1614_001517 [Plenodomus biglobosus]